MPYETRPGPNSAVDCSTAGGSQFVSGSKGEDHEGIQISLAFKIEILDSSKAAVESGHIKLSLRPSGAVFPS